MFDVEIVFGKLFILRRWIYVNAPLCEVMTGLEIEMNKSNRRLFLYQIVETAKNSYQNNTEKLLLYGNWNDVWRGRMINVMVSRLFISQMGIINAYYFYNFFNRNFV